MSETEASTIDVQKLRRGLGDLAALSALPVIWTESDPRRIAESLADALLHMLHLELVYILVRDRAYESPVEVAHTARGPAPNAQAEEIGRVLDPWLNSNDLSRTPTSIANPLGNGMTRIICPPFGIEARGGVLVACSPRADFPSEVDRLLLGVAANQVAILLDRRRTEDALRESEERFRGTFENAAVGIADCDLQGRFLRVNQRLCEIVGYTREELLQKTWQDITHPDDLAASLEQFGPLLRGEQPRYSLEKRLVRKDGSPVWIDQAVSLRRDAAGAPASVIAILQDISERKRLEEELSQSNARLGLAVRGSNINIHEANMPDGVLENSRWEVVSVGELRGYDPSDWPTDFTTLMASVHPDDRERVERAMRAYLSGQTREYMVEGRVRLKDGSYRWFLGRGVAVRDAEGTAIRFMTGSVDITDLKRAEEALRESEQRFRTFVDHATDAFFLQDDRHVVLDVNRQACLSLGYTRDELVGTTPLGFDSDVTPAMLEEFGRRLDTGEVLVFESRHRRKDGSVFPVEVRGRPFWEGGRRFTVALARDITEHKRSEEALRESERRFRTLSEALPHVVWTAGPDGALDYLNARASEFSGIAPEQLRGSDWQSIVHPEDLPRLGELWARSIATGEPCEIEHRARRADGAFRWHLARALPLRDDSGRITKWFGATIDIDDQKRAEEALRESECRFRGTFENAAVGIAHTHPEGRLLRVNEKFCAIVGYPREELLQKTWHDITHPDDLAASGDVSAAALRGESPGLPLEKRYLRKDGSLVWGELVISLQRDAAGAPGYLIAIVQDISRRKRLEEALRESERRFRTFVDHATDAFFLQDDRLVVVDVNRQACLSLGYTRDELVGTTPLDFDLDVTPAMLEEFGRRLDTGEVLVFESRHRRKDGSVFPVEVRGRPFWEGGRRFTVALARDITEHNRSEEALRDSERRFRTLTEAIPLMVWTAEPDGATDYFNARTTEYTGLTQEQLRGWDWRSTIHPEDLPRCLELWTRSIATGELYEIEFRVRRADGAFRWHLARALALRDDSGRITKWFGSCFDIDDQKRAQEALRESERQFRTLTETVPAQVWTTDPDGANDYLNTRTTEYTGLTLEQLRGWNWQPTIHPEDLPRCLELWTRSIATGEPYEIEYRLRRADGAFRWHLTRALALRDDSGRITKWFGSCIDIDDQKRAQEALREAAAAADAANRAKDEFLANVSHEIRTPMNAILGMTELVLDTPLTEDQRQCLKTVKSAADNLLGLMNDLLDFSKIEAGKLELDPADFSLRAAVGDTLRALAVRAHTKGLELIYDVQPDLPDALVGDAGRLRQVLLNLVGNAIKFTEEGEVVVRVEVTGEAASEDEVGLLFTVRDTGMGIPRDQHERIFRAFEQEDTSTTRKYGGTGLGLTIAARLVALMGGRITVESEPGRGSTFAFTARLGRLPHPPEQVPARPPASLRNLPVLVVDDNATNRHILEEWLRGWQMEPAAVGDGLAALDALWHAVSLGRPYALVLLDARMPDTDGLALAAKIRKRAELAATRIILLTSGERPGDWERIRERRIDAQLLKPVQQDELLETIYRVMSRANGDTPPTAGPMGGGEPTSTPVPAPAPLHILVAEDNEINAQLLERLLVRRGHRVRLANNGREALALAEDGGFDLLLLDVHMPELDGFQVIRAVRDRERSVGGHLPVIALTAGARQEDRERCLAAGMDDFLAKPIQAADLWVATERVTGSRPPADRPRLGLLDSRVLLAACGGDAATLEEIGQVLRARLPDHLTAAQEALRERDAVRLREAAHKLCGTVAAFSTVVGSVASDLEDHAARGQLEEARPLVEQLDAIVRELIHQVEGLSIEALRD